MCTRMYAHVEKEQQDKEILGEEKGHDCHMHAKHDVQDRGVPNLHS